VTPSAGTAYSDYANTYYYSGYPMGYSYLYGEGYYGYYGGYPYRYRSGYRGYDGFYGNRAGVGIGGGPNGAGVSIGGRVFGRR
jgi:hypothetical protein